MLERLARGRATLTNGRTGWGKAATQKMTARTQDSGPSPPGSLPWCPPEQAGMGLLTEVRSQQTCRASKAVSFQEYRGTWREVWVGRLKEVIDGSGKVVNEQ